MGGWQIECAVAAREDLAWADRVVITPWLVGVVDGSTQKPWQNSAYGGADVADEVVCALQRFDPAMTMGEAVSRITERVRPHVAAAPRGSGPCATLAVFNMQRREVWRLGDPWVLMDGMSVPGRGAGEAELAGRRAAVLRELLSQGDSLTELQRTDPGRQSILGDLRSLGEARNGSGAWAVGVIDGWPVPPRLMEIMPVAEDVREVILATDGYPEPPQDLQRAEASLAIRLDRDPLLIEEPAMTKAALPGRSFDDRTFVRVMTEMHSSE